MYALVINYEPEPSEPSEPSPPINKQTFDAYEDFDHNRERHRGNYLGIGEGDRHAASVYIKNEDREERLQFLKSLKLKARGRRKRKQKNKSKKKKKKSKKR